jgi:hypothetical protein
MRHQRARHARALWLCRHRVHDDSRHPIDQVSPPASCAVEQTLAMRSRQPWPDGRAFRCVWPRALPFLAFSNSQLVRDTICPRGTCFRRRQQ